MADNNSPPSTPTPDGNKAEPVSGKQVTKQGIQLLPLLIRYFKTAGLLILVWFVGYFGFSSSWVMIGLFFHMANKEYQKIKVAKKAFAQQAQQDEKQAILARVEELPAWVFFPDVERAEWLNKMIKQMWPYIGEYTTRLLKDSVEPQVQNSLPNSLKPFKFEKIDLGDIPPRIGGVKVYTENVKRDEIYLDLELFHASDCDITVAVRGMNAGIKDLQIHGTLRVIMKPLVPIMPILGGLQVFFLNQPTIDFDMTNIANLLDLPLLSNTLRSVIEDQIAYYLVLPNKIPIQLVDSVHLSALKYPMPQGVLRLLVMAGRELKAADVGLGKKKKSDPYCKLYVGAQTFKTKTIENTVNPVWNQYYEAVVDQKHGQFVEMEVLDKDPGDDDELGTCSFEIAGVYNQGTMDTWLPLENVKTGMVHMRALWLHLSKDPQDLDKETIYRNDRKSYDPCKGMLQGSYEQTVRAGSEEHLSSAILMVHLDSAKSLPKVLSEPSPYVKLSIGNETKKSVPKAKTTDPKWEENFQFLIHDPRIQNLDLNVFDSAKNDKKLGNCTISLKNLLTSKDLTINRPFQLRESGPESKISLRLCLRILTSEKPEDWAMDETAQVTDPTPAATPVVPDPVENPPASKTENIAIKTPDATVVIEPTKPTKPSSPVSETVEATNVTNVETIPANFTVGENGSNESSILDRAGSQLRHRVVSSTASDSGLGRIQLTLRYSPQRSKLVVVIHKCVNLIPCDEDNLADPYVRIYLMPDRSSSSKRKTQTVKNNLNPIFDETHEWPVSQAEAQTRTLDVMVKNSIGIFSKSRAHMGQAIVDLSHFDLSNATTEWFELQEEKED